MSWSDGISSRLWTQSRRKMMWVSKPALERRRDVPDARVLDAVDRHQDDGELLGSRLGAVGAGASSCMVISTPSADARRGGRVRGFGSV